MAKRNVLKPKHSASIDALFVVESDEWATRATGTKEQLIKSGMCVPAHFPDGRKRSHYSKEYSLTKKGNTWTLIIYATQEQREQRRQARLDREAQERRMQATPKTALDWRENKLFALKLALAAIAKCTESDGGFHFCDEDVSLIRALSNRLAMVVNNAQVHVEPNWVNADEGSTPMQATVATLRAPLRLVSA